MATSVTSRIFLGTGIVIDERIVEIQQGASAVLGLASAGFAKVRVIFAQIDQEWPLSLTAYTARFANWP